MQKREPFRSSKEGVANQEKKNEVQTASHIYINTSYGPARVHVPTGSGLFDTVSIRGRTIDPCIVFQVVFAVLLLSWVGLILYTILAGGSRK
mmetsp:Transcript_17325/g.19717  ORF Transcript_17325/g.19717 Transcript_17325/m.19717 type:complete len:92 (+) Transcript_17325:288-563(+)